MRPVKGGVKPYLDSKKIYLSTSSKDLLFERKQTTKEEMATLRLEDLPDELILEVFSFLGSRDLICMGQMSNRIRAISYDEQLWQKLNLYHEPSKDALMGEFMGMTFSDSEAAIAASEKMPARFLKIAINNGCKYLSLCPNQVDGNLGLDQASSLIYLKVQQPKTLPNFPNFTKFSVLEELLSSCHSLKKLSMNSVTLHFDEVYTICNQNGRTLQILNLNGCQIVESWEVELKLVQTIVRSCTNLKEVNFDSTNLSEEAIQYLVENITPSIELLSLNYEVCVSDEHIKILVNRCRQLKTLNLAHTLAITSGSLNAIIENLKPFLERLDVSGAQLIDPMNLLDLRAMPKLQILIGSPPLSIIEQLENDLPNLVIYDFCHDEVDHLQFFDNFTLSENLLDRDGIWEIKAKPLKLFSSSQWLEMQFLH